MEEVLGFVVTILALAIIGFIMYVLKKTMDSLVVLTSKIGTRTKHLTAKTIKMFKNTDFFSNSNKRELLKESLSLVFFFYLEPVRQRNNIPEGKITKILVSILQYYEFSNEKQLEEMDKQVRLYEKLLYLQNEPNLEPPIVEAENRMRYLSQHRFSFPFGEECQSYNEIEALYPVMITTLKVVDMLLKASCEPIKTK